MEMIESQMNERISQTIAYMNEMTSWILDLFLVCGLSHALLFHSMKEIPMYHKSLTLWITYL